MIDSKSKSDNMHYINQYLLLYFIYSESRRGVKSQNVTVFIRDTEPIEH